MVSDPAAIDPSQQRNQCNYCDGVKFDPECHEYALVPCNLEAFGNRSFRVWRCDRCSSLHCLDVVDLDHYYAGYAFSDLKLSPVLRLSYRKLANRLLQHGMKPHDKFLDYGCNNGIFCQSLHERGYTNVTGYDPYSSAEFNDISVIRQNAPFDYILIQDVLEHVESPIGLLRELDDLLAPGGYILIGTPNAETIDLKKKEEYRNHLHAPYHLHIPTRAVVEGMGRTVGLTPVAFYDRSYFDTHWFGLNTRAYLRYQDLKGGFADELTKPIDLLKVIFSPSIWFYAIFGYWLSNKGDMSCMLHKPAKSLFEAEESTIDPKDAESLFFEEVDVLNELEPEHYG